MTAFFIGAMRLVRDDGKSRSRFLRIRRGASNARGMTKAMRGSLGYAALMRSFARDDGVRWMVALPMA